MQRRASIPATISLAIASSIWAFGAQAQTGNDFFKGKTITVTVAVGTGAYDLYARLLARHMPKFIPGNPNMIINNMPGAGGVVAANHAANIAPRDGTALLVPLKPIAMTQVLNPTQVRYDASRFQWIGSMVDAPGVLVLSKTSNINSIDDARKSEVPMGSTGAGAETAIFPTVINSALGTRFKVISGFKGMSDIFLALERGEIHGVSTVYGSVQGLKPEWIKEAKITFLARIAATRAKELPNVPTVLELARTPAEREVLEFLTLSNSVGRSITAPPEVPAAQIAILRKAFDETVRSPDYLKETVEKGIEVNPIPGVEVQKDVSRLIAIPKSTVEKVQQALSGIQKSTK